MFTPEPSSPSWASPPTGAVPPGYAPPSNDPYGAPQQVRRPLRLKSTNQLAVTIQVLTALSVGHAFVSLVVEDQLARLFGSAAKTGSASSATLDLYDLSAVVAVVGALVLVLNAILTMAMMKRMADNGAAMRPGFSDHKSHWAITGWFVPFLSLVRPYQMMLQIWITSHRNTEDRSTPHLPLVINLWWASFLLFLIADRITPSAPWNDPTFLELANESRGISIVSAIRGVAALLFLFTVRTISAQHERALAAHR